MLRYIQEEDKYVEITGFKNVKLQEAEQLLKTAKARKQNSVLVQFFNAEFIASWEHLYFAVLNAICAFRTERNISKNMAIEIILYASAQRQIRKAFEQIGVKSKCADVAVVIVGEEPEAVETTLASVSKYLYSEPDEHVLELTPAKTQKIKRVFEITDTELAVVENTNANCALVNLIIERMALLATRI